MGCSSSKRTKEPKEDFGAEEHPNGMEGHATNEVGDEHAPYDPYHADDEQQQQQHHDDYDQHHQDHNHQAAAGESGSPDEVEGGSNVTDFGSPASGEACGAGSPVAPDDARNDFVEEEEEKRVEREVSPSVSPAKKKIVKSCPRSAHERSPQPERAAPTVASPLIKVNPTRTYD